MDKYFINVYGSPDKKTPIVEKIIHENNLKKNETVFLGDALSDYNAAKENNIDFFLRLTPENKTLFPESMKLIRFIDFYKLDKQLSN